MPLAEFSYNNSLHTSISMTPFQPLYGTHPRVLPDNPREESSVPGSADFLQEQLAAQALLKQQLEQAKQSYKKAADTHWQEGPLIAVGNNVWLSTKFLASSRP